MTVLARLMGAILHQCLEINRAFGMMFGQIEPGEPSSKKEGDNDA